MQSQPQNSIFNSFPITGGGNGLDPVTNGWLARISNAGGASPSNNSINAVNTFWLACKSAGIDSLIYALNPFVPDNLIAACTPLVQNVGFPSWHNVNLGGQQFQNADLSVGGLDSSSNENPAQATYDATNDLYTKGKYLDPGFPLNTFSMTDGGISFFHNYVSNNVGQDGANSIAGAYPSDNSPHLFGLLTYGSGLQDAFDMFAIEHRIFDNSSNLLPCFASVNRVGNNLDLYNNLGPLGAYQTYLSDHTGSSSATGALTLAQQTAKIFLFATNSYTLPDGSDGVVVRMSTSQVSFFAFHHGMTFAQSHSLYNAATAMRASLGGGSYP